MPRLVKFVGLIVSVLLTVLTMLPSLIQLPAPRSPGPASITPLPMITVSLAALTTRLVPVPVSLAEIASSASLMVKSEPEK